MNTNYTYQISPAYSTSSDMKLSHLRNKRNSDLVSAFSVSGGPQPNHFSQSWSGGQRMAFSNVRTGFCFVILVYTGHSRL